MPTHKTDTFRRTPTPKCPSKARAGFKTYRNTAHVLKLYELEFDHLPLFDIVCGQSDGLCGLGALAVAEAVVGLVGKDLDRARSTVVYDT